LLLTFGVAVTSFVRASILDTWLISAFAADARRRRRRAPEHLVGIRMLAWTCPVRDRAMDVAQVVALSDPDGAAPRATSCVCEARKPNRAGSANRLATTGGRATDDLDERR
jgi:hypothetical protein